MTLKGIYSPIVTPFTNEKVNLSYFEENIVQWNSSTLSGYVVFGSTGESVHLTDAEKIDLLKSAKRMASPEKVLIAGTGKASTQQTIAFTNMAAEAGAEFALVITPYFYKKQQNDTMMLAHFSTVADRSEIPVIIYNVPKFTNVDLQKSVICKLAQHPNIVGIKDSSGNIHKITEVIEETPDDFTVLLGNASLLLPGLLMGADGAILALCNMAFKQVTEIYDACCAQSYAIAKHKFTALMPLIQSILNTYGIPGIKAAMDMVGFHGGEVRKPLLPLDSRSLENIKSILKTSQLIS